MLGFRFCGITPTRTVSNGFLLPGAAVTRPATPEICRSMTADQHLSCLPLQRPFSLLLNQYQDLSPRQFSRNTMCHWLNPSQLLQSRLTSPRLLLSFSNSAFTKSPIRVCSPRLLPSFSNTAFTKSSIRGCLMPKPISWRSHATSHEPHTFFIQPLDPSCRRQSIRRGFVISLPILIIYLLLYLLGIVLHRTELGRHHLDTVVRFWTYTRHEDLQNVASLCTFVTSQFTHRSLAPMVMDSLILVGIASVLSSVFNRRTFFAVYVLGGFLAAAADCAWARVINPCQSITQAQLDEILTTVRVIDEATAKFNELRSSLKLFTWKSFVKFWTDPREFFEKLAKDPVHKESKRQLEIINEHYPIVRDWVRWNERNWASSGSLICLSMLSTHGSVSLHIRGNHSDANVERNLVSVATMIRPRTIVNFRGVRPKFQLYSLTAWFFAFSVYMHLATNSR